MRLTIVTLTILLFMQAGALASQSKLVQLSSSLPVQSVQITDQKFEPIYAQKPYETTCSREVFSHNESRCSTYNDSVCSGGGTVCETTNDSVCNSSGCVTVPRRSCHQTSQSCTSVPRTSCTEHPVYRTEHYSCTQYRTIVVGQNLVKTYHHSVEVALDHELIALGANLTVSVDVSHSIVSASLSGSFASHILNFEVLDLSNQDSGGVQSLAKKIIIKKGLSKQEAQQILSAKIEEIELGYEEVNFNIVGTPALAKHLDVGFRLVRNRLIGSDSNLYSGTLKSTKLKMTQVGSVLKVVLPFEVVGIDSISRNKHDVILSLSLSRSSMLNASDFSAELNKKVEVKEKKLKPYF